jgi:hypothetical protein
MDETAQGRVKSPNYRSASQLYDAGYKEYITDLSYVYLVNPPRMLCAPTQPLRAGRDFWWVCIEEEQSLPIPSRPGKACARRSTEKDQRARSLVPGKSDSL